MENVFPLLESAEITRLFLTISTTNQREIFYIKLKILSEPNTKKRKFLFLLFITARNRVTHKKADSNGMEMKNSTISVEMQSFTELEHGWSERERKKLEQRQRTIYWAAEKTSFRPKARFLRSQFSFSFLLHKGNSFQLIFFFLSSDINQQVV